MTAGAPSHPPATQRQSLAKGSTTGKGSRPVTGTRAHTGPVSLKHTDTADAGTNVTWGLGGVGT